ncbi:MAG: DUF11 domain-containing protein [Chloroflexi bacterium]|nr:DUF11 domain-containing protein [Chloroflexota bacterium]
MIESKPTSVVNVPTYAKIGLIVLITVVPLLLTLSIVIAQSPIFNSSTKTGPQYARYNDTITYTIVAINTGSPVQNVTLTDVLPSGVEFVPGSCTYNEGAWSWPCDDDPPNPMWDPKNFAPGTRITTTFRALVTASTAGTAYIPLINYAYIDWGSGVQPVTATTMILSAIPEFDLFYEPSPPNADTGEAITYTIVAVNNGDSVSNVVLSDTLPNGVSFVPGSCSYVVATPGTLNFSRSCYDQPLTPGQDRLVWQEDMAHGVRITTTFVVSVIVREGSARWPLQNCAHLGWGIIQEELCSTSLANPTVYIYLPMLMRNYSRDNYEPNDTPEQAYGPLVSGRVYQAYIWDAMDQDDYYYITPVSSTLTVDAQVQLTNIPVDRDYDLYIYYYDPSACAPYNGYCEVANSVEPGNTDESVTFTPTGGRRYYIRVFSDIMSGGYDDEQSYHLIATYQ